MKRIFERTSITQHTLLNIAKDSTGGGPLDVSGGEAEKFQEGILKNVMIHSETSVDYDIHIGQKRHFVFGGPHEIYVANNVNLKKIEDVTRGWINNDTDELGASSKTSNLYAVIVNNDSSNATGAITIQMMNDVNKR